MGNLPVCGSCDNVILKGDRITIVYTGTFNGEDITTPEEEGFLCGQCEATIRSRA